MPPDILPFITEFEKDLWLSFRRQVQRFSKKKEVTLFCAVTQASADCAELQNRHFSKNPELVEVGIRDTIFSLQLILSHLEYVPRSDNLSSSFTEFQMSEKQEKDIYDLFKAASEMSVMYDIFKCFWTRGYKAEAIADSHVVFRDEEDWKGLRDYAQREISVLVKKSRAKKKLAKDVQDVLGDMAESVALPPDIPLFSTTVRNLSRAWVRIVGSLKPAFLSGRIILESNSTLFRFVKASTNTSDQEVNSILGLWRFGFNQPFERSLFLHPVIPFSRNESFFFVYPIFHARIEVAISRYLIYRTNTYDSYSNAVEGYLIELLQKQFSREDQVFISNKKFVFEGARREIDCIIYEKHSGRVYAIETKYFVLPDAVQEVLNCNKKLAKAIDQVEKIQKWAESENGLTIRGWLGIDEKLPIEFRYLIIGNGFSGSDYLEKVSLFPIVDYQYLMQHEFIKSDFGKSVDKYIEDFQRLSSQVSSQEGSHRFEIYGKIIEAPYSKKIEY